VYRPIQMAQVATARLDQNTRYVAHNTYASARANNIHNYEKK